MPPSMYSLLFFFFNDTATTEIYTLSLHDALPIHPLVRRRQRVRLVDEEDAVERAPNRPVGLERGRADVLADEPCPVDLDEVAAPEQTHRAVHLRQQAGDRRLARARVAEEDEVLRGRDLGEAVALPLGLHLEEGDERPHLLLDGFEAGQRIELVLQLGERLPRFRLAQRVDLVGDPVGRLAAL